jgi:hypothetical protein
MTQRIDLLRRHGPALDHLEDRHLVVDRALTASTAAFALALRYRSRLPFGQGKWAGQYDSALTQKTFVHASDDDLRVPRWPGFTRSFRSCERSGLPAAVRAILRDLILRP